MLTEYQKSVLLCVGMRSRWDSDQSRTVKVLIRIAMILFDKIINSGDELSDGFDNYENLLKRMLDGEDVRKEIEIIGSKSQRFHTGHVVHSFHYGTAYLADSIKFENGIAIQSCVSFFDKCANRLNNGNGSDILQNIIDDLDAENL